MLEKINDTCFMHICLLYIYIALREAKAILDERVKKRGTRVRRSVCQQGEDNQLPFNLPGTIKPNEMGC